MQQSKDCKFKAVTLDNYHQEAVCVIFIMAFTLSCHLPMPARESVHLSKMPSKLHGASTVQHEVYLLPTALAPNYSNHIQPFLNSQRFPWTLML